MFRLLSTVMAFALSVNAVARTNPPPGAKVVAATGGDFASLQDAIDSINKDSTDTTTIFIQPGTYSGQTLISPGYSGKIVIYGSTPDDQDYAKNEVILTHSLSSTQAGGKEKSGTLRVHSPNVSFYNLNIRNTAGALGPAHALSSAADQISFYGCSFTGWQNTVYGINTASFFKNSYVEGAVTFITGDENVNFWFDECIIASNRRPGSYIASSGRKSAEDNGWFVINNSRVVAKTGVTILPNSVILGRPLGTYDRTIYQNTELPDLVNPMGWDHWDFETTNVYHGEYNNRGPGANMARRSAWVKALASAVSLNDVIPGWEDWVDQEY